MLTVDSMLAADFRVEQSEQILGTPIYVVFAYRNRGPHPLSFVIGNGRSDSFRFEPSPPATALDPYYEFGGLAAITHVAPGERHEHEVLLNKYLHFSRPGRYVVRAELDVDVTDATSGTVHPQKIRGQLELNLKDDAARQQAILTALEADLKGEDAERQFRASHALSELREKRVVPIIVRGLSSDNTAVVEELLLGLGRVDSDDARDALRAFVASTNSPYLRDLARQQLTRPSY